MTDFEGLRRGMVDGQIRVADVTDRRILGAFLSVPRERFVPAERVDLAYLDTRVPYGRGRAALEPMTLARLIQLAAPHEGERVLVVGCGLGYTAALFDELGAKVVALEVDSGLATEARERLADRKGVTVAEGPLPDGAPAYAPYDLIFCDGAVSGGLDVLARQLAPQGRIVAPAGEGRPTKATIFRPHEGRLAAASSFDAYGPQLPGLESPKAFAF